LEQISFVIPFGDTTDPNEIAKKIAQELQFRTWMVRQSETNADDEGIAAITFVLMGWTTEW
jgi:capsule polysaccharide modification protein KpsS